MTDYRSRPDPGRRRRKSAKSDAAIAGMIQSGLVDHGCYYSDSLATRRAARPPAAHNGPDGSGAGDVGLGQDLEPAFLGQVVDEDDAVEVVGLVLKAAGQQPGPSTVIGAPVTVDPGHRGHVGPGEFGLAARVRTGSLRVGDQAGDGHVGRASSG